MNWEEELNILLEERSISQIVEYLLESPEQIPSLVKISKHENEKIAWRAAWVLDHLNMQAPSLAEPFYPKFLQILKKTHFSGVRRSLLKIIITAPTVIKEDGELLDLCFKWIVSPDIPIAVRVNSMQYVHDLLPEYPELKNEFRHSLLLALDDQSKGVKARAGKILTNLSYT